VLCSHALVFRTSDVRQQIFVEDARATSKREPNKMGELIQEFSKGARNQKLTITVFLIEKTRQRPLPGPKSMANNVPSRGWTRYDATYTLMSFLSTCSAVAVCVISTGRMKIKQQLPLFSPQRAGSGCAAGRRRTWRAASCRTRAPWSSPGGC
jgi:hypothetical protein